MKMYVPFYYEKCGRIEVEANNISEQIKNNNKKSNVAYEKMISGTER